MTKIALIGCGKMGGAILEGWLQSDIEADDITVFDPSTDIQQRFPDLLRDNIYPSLADYDSESHFDAVMIAVKPQVMAEILSRAPVGFFKDAVIISVAAGKTIQALEELCGTEQAIIRTMPNTPAAIGLGMTVCYGNNHVSDQQKLLASQLLEVVGAVDWVEKESLMDAVTAVSGSGPAYVFHLAETMTAAGVKQGLSEALAAKLALQTIMGAGQLMVQSDYTPSQLREMVTSPNGTTQAALDVLMSEQGLPPLMHRAIAAATARSKELA